MEADLRNEMEARIGACEARTELRLNEAQMTQEKFNLQLQQQFIEFRLSVERSLAQVTTELTRLSANVELQGTRLDAKIDAQGERLDGKIDALRTDLFNKIDSRADRTTATIVMWITAIQIATLALAVGIRLH